MKVILLEDIFGTGNAGDVVEVKNGFARNKLLPEKLAILANESNLKTLEHRRAHFAAKRAANKEAAEAFAAKVGGAELTFTVKAGETGKLFGSVTAQDVADAIKEKLGFELDKKKIALETPIREIGRREVGIRVFTDVTPTVIVNVEPEGGLPIPEPEVETPEVNYEDFEEKEEASEAAAEEASEAAADDTTEDADTDVIASEARQSSEDEEPAVEEETPEDNG